jgi:hypothetical protein
LTNGTTVVNSLSSHIQSVAKVFARLVFFSVFVFYSRSIAPLGSPGIVDDRLFIRDLTFYVTIIIL